MSHLIRVTGYVCAWYFRHFLPRDESKVLGRAIFHLNSFNKLEGFLIMAPFVSGSLRGCTHMYYYSEGI